MHTPRILLINADEDTHQGLRGSLERRGCLVFEAATQGEAVQRAGEVAADLVVQENPVQRPDRPGSFDEIVGAVELLAGPLPIPAAQANQRADDAAITTVGRGLAPRDGCRLLPRSFHARALLAAAR
jgi:hypothetical protein